MGTESLHELEGYSAKTKVKVEALPRAMDQEEQGWRSWLQIGKVILPIFLATHLAVLFVSYFSVLSDISDAAHPLLSRPAIDFFNHFMRWDSGNFIHIARSGYTSDHGGADITRTAFFPLYPMLIRLLSWIPGLTPESSALIIGNLAGFGLIVVLYRLAKEEFNAGVGYKTVLALVLFPSAFFLIVAYNESLFLFLVLLYFYHLRKGNWWLAGVCGLFASLTRSAGCFLCLPFLYEYLRQHEFRLKRLRLRQIVRPQVLAISLIPIGTVLFACYCYYRFNNFLAFQQVQQGWGRWLDYPWFGLFQAFSVLVRLPFLSYGSIRTMVDLLPTLLIATMLVLGFVGPWRYPKEKLVYPLWGACIFLFFLTVPSHKIYSMEAQGRFMLELFPAFLMLGRIGQAKPQWSLFYLFPAYAMQALFLVQFMLGHWMV